MPLFTPRKIQVSPLPLQEIRVDSASVASAGTSRTTSSRTPSTLSHCLSMSSLDIVHCSEAFPVGLAVAQTFRGHKGHVRCLASDGGRTLLSGSLDGTVIAWDMHKAVRMGELLCRSPVIGVAAHAGKVYCGLENGKVQCWDLASLTLLREEEHGIGSVFVVRVANDLNYVLSGGADGCVRVWDLELNPLFTLEGHTDPILALTVVPTDHATVFSASIDRTVRRYNLHSREIVQTLYVGGVTSGPACCVTVVDDTTVAVGTGNNIAKWDLDGSARVPAFICAGHKGTVYCLDSLGPFCLSGGQDGTVRVWDLHTGDLLATNSEHQHEVMALLLVKTSHDWLIFTAAADRCVKRWVLRRTDEQAA